MASRNLEQWIQAIRQGDLGQGARLLLIALKNDPLARQERVNTFLWFAETTSDAALKVEYYETALQIDPTNQDVNGRLSYWLKQFSPEMIYAEAKRLKAEGNSEEATRQFSRILLEDIDNAIGITYLHLPASLHPQNRATHLRKSA